MGQASEGVKSRQVDAAREWPNNLKSGTKRKGTQAFDVRALLDLAVTQNCVEYKSKEIVFAQSDPATSARWVQEGGVTLSQEIVACLCGFLLTVERFARPQGNA
jgi:hypothetical protein